MRSRNNRFGLEGGARRIFHSKRPRYRRRCRGVRHGYENAVPKMCALLAPSRKCRSKCGPSRFVRPLRKRRRVGEGNGGTSLSPRRDALLHIQDARKRVPPLHKRTTDLQSVRPAEWRLPAVLHSAKRATKSAAPSAGNAAAGYKSAGRTCQRPVFRV